MFQSFGTCFALLPRDSALLFSCSTLVESLLTLSVSRFSLAVALHLHLTWWHIGEVAASQKFGRGSNFQIRTAVAAGILPLSRQYAR